MDAFPKLVSPVFLSRLISMANSFLALVQFHIVPRGISWQSRTLRGAVTFFTDAALCGIQFYAFPQGD
ncbi:hypothetical protein [Bradyrhizobium sp. NAS80.1]|uniref:hypothetical protein n=1 Tax=Bradyrhizobium sp. NAS80.1 TaxID=1680159 RepID=UPI0011612021|nr:hypothetical protein [Bradyrhizobium sp. NAS80.1]